MKRLLRLSEWMPTGRSRLVSLVLTDPAGKYWLDYGVLIDDPKLGQADGAQLKA